MTVVRGGGHSLGFDVRVKETVRSIHAEGSKATGYPGDAQDVNQATARTQPQEAETGEPEAEYEEDEEEEEEQEEDGPADKDAGDSEAATEGSGPVENGQESGAKAKTPVGEARAVDGSSASVEEQRILDFQLLKLNRSNLPWDSLAFANESDPLGWGRHLITTFFKGTYKQDRIDELVMALRLNLRNPLIARVHVLFEDEDPTQYILDPELRHKLVAVKVAHQPTYMELFNYGSEKLARGTMAIIANADIYFDHTLRCLKTMNRNWAQLCLSAKAAAAISCHDQAAQLVL